MTLLFEENITFPTVMSYIFGEHPNESLPDPKSLSQSGRGT